jgi:monofunctional glycosyltransferase
MPRADERWSPARGRRAPPEGRRRWSFRAILLGLVLLSIAPVVIYRFVPPPITALMLMRRFEGEPIRKTWVPLDRISPALVRAVVASEDEKFCFHHGFDWSEMRAAWRDFRAGRRARGASTISMQTAKNVFLWPGRNIVRKGFEAYYTALIELLWSKPRIMEVYLNVIEWGHGMYGAEAAARAYFRKSAASLTPSEAAMLAAVLPNPRQFSAARPSAYVEERVAVIRSRMPAMTLPLGRGCP